MTKTKHCLQCNKNFLKPVNESKEKWNNRHKFCSIVCKNNFSKGKYYRHPKALNKSRGKTIFKDGKKLCPMCKEWKFLSEYHKRSERPLGIKPKCKSCEFMRQRQDMKALRLTQIKSGAKKRGIEFNLSKDEFLTFWGKPCFYCGDKIPTIGLDRINSDEGYSIGNVVSCCAICNTMKLAISRDVFIQHCYKIIKKHIPDAA